MHLTECFVKLCRVRKSWQAVACIIGQYRYISIIMHGSVHVYTAITFLVDPVNCGVSPGVVSACLSVSEREGDVNTPPS